MSDLNQLITEYHDSFKKLTTEFGQKFPSLFTHIFDKYANLNSITFYAYANFFNDGDPCPFNICTYQFQITWGPNNTKITLNEDAWGKEEDFDDVIYTDLWNMIYQILKKIPDNVVQTIFGDDVQVTINKNGTVDSSYYGKHD